MKRRLGTLLVAIILGGCGGREVASRDSGIDGDGSGGTNVGTDGAAETGGRVGNGGNGGSSASGGSSESGGSSGSGGAGGMVGTGGTGTGGCLALPPASCAAGTGGSSTGGTAGSAGGASGAGGGGPPTYCYEYVPGVPGGTRSRSCSPLPATCSQPYCSCVCPRPTGSTSGYCQGSGGPFCYCSEGNGTVDVICYGS